MKNATHAVANVDDYSGSARLLAATTLRNVLGTLSLGDILSQVWKIIVKMIMSLIDILSQVMMTMMMCIMNILSQRETIAREMQSTLDDATEAWGVQVERVEVTKKFTFGEIIRIHLKL